jgi:hypothetical protein
VRSEVGFRRSSLVRSPEFLDVRILYPYGTKDDEKRDFFVEASTFRNSTSRERLDGGIFFDDRGQKRIDYRRHHHSSCNASNGSYEMKGCMLTRVREERKTPRSRGVDEEVRCFRNLVGGRGEGTIAASQSQSQYGEILCDVLLFFFFLLFGVEDL